MKKNLQKTGKFLSLILRHQPQVIGLSLDINGWVDVNVLIEALSQNGHPIELDDLKYIVDNNNKKRFSFDDDFQNIRANQGHSIEVDLNLSLQIPPATLFHGTAVQFVNNIRIEGLKKRNRQHVHLSHETETATIVGQRHGKAVILKIDTQAMISAGHSFYLSENGVWLTEEVAPEFIEFPE